MSTFSLKMEDGRELEIKHGSHVYLKEKDGAENYWEWQYVTQVQEKLDTVLAQAEGLFADARAAMPDLKRGAIK